LYILFKNSTGHVCIKLLKFEVIPVHLYVQTVVGLWHIRA